MSVAVLAYDESKLWAAKKTPIDSEIAISTVHMAVQKTIAPVANTRVSSSKERAKKNKLNYRIRSSETTVRYNSKHPSLIPEHFEWRERIYPLVRRVDDGTFKIAIINENQELQSRRPAGTTQ
ncbi:uncharacterized protein IUM83_09601 [Phytophthora cinnamomi]|uniref:uncharacterized protein n=1 Tax=Phytophthora cinnamomi TaxID=4785 RepID=UPI00355AB105|nr:hypothetical protein IUM83_09601 [Phytophthora cinnamomi]